MVRRGRGGWGLEPPGGGGECLGELARGATGEGDAQAAGEGAVDSKAQGRGGGGEVHGRQRGVQVSCELGLRDEPPRGDGRGPKDIAKEQLAIVRRVTPEGEKRKAFVPEVQALDQLPGKLDAFQTELLHAARTRREENTVRGVQSIDELAEALDAGAGFVLTGWSGDPSVEAAVKERTKATLRAIVDEEFRSATAPAKCVSGLSASIGEVAWARAY